MKANHVEMRLGLGFVALLCMTVMAQAAPPAGYYDDVDSTDSDSMRDSVHGVIDDHTRFPYTSSATDTWDILDDADEDPNNSSNVLDIYKNASYTKEGGGNSNYQREHSWPKSYGFPKDNSSNYPYTDCHHLFIANGSYNSSRSNRPYDTCDGTCSEKTTEVNNGQGGGSGTYLGNSNWTASGIWETWIGRRGDVARAMFYMDVRYEGGTHGGTSASEPDLILTDNDTLIVSDTSENKSVAYMGMLSVLLDWHLDDPVDDVERDRNDVVYTHQGNRNPFIDHPEWVECIFEDKCRLPFINELHYDNTGGDTNEFVEVAGYEGTNLSGWKLLGYNGADGTVYKTVNLSGTIPDQEGCMGTLKFAFGSFQNGPDGIALVNGSNEVVQFLSYEGTFTATDGAADGMESEDIGVSETSSTPVGHSLQVDGTGDHRSHFTWQAAAADTDGAVNTGQTLDGFCVTGGGPVYDDPWINEIHYDNDGSDTGEFVEVAGPEGLSLSNWKLIGYNGSNGKKYKTVTLSGTIPNDSNGFGVIAFAFSGLQNGGPDGIALVDDSNNVIQFLSYEGSFTATDGEADGETSTDIGVSESSSTPVGESLRLSGTNGCAYADFTWQSPAAETEGSINTGQTFSSSCP
ncbi:MAG: endonuclease [Phycisphaerales bacterium]|nr:endonuclease [Phycisphaerales bacterium]